MGDEPIRQNRKGFQRTAQAPADIETRDEQLRRAGVLGGGRGFLYEWEEGLAALDSRLAALEFGPGLTPASIPFLTATPVEITASAGTLCGYMVFNPNAAPAYIQVFDALAADVVLGTTVSNYFLSIPESSAANMALNPGITHNTAITVAATDAPDGNNGPPIPLNVSLFYR